MTVSTGTNNGRFSHHFSLQNTSQNQTLSVSENRKLLLSSSYKIALAITMVAISVLTLAAESRSRAYLDKGSLLASKKDLSQIPSLFTKAAAKITPCVTGIITLSTSNPALHLVSFPLLLNCFNLPGVKAEQISQFPATINLAEIDPTNGFKITGDNGGDRNGFSVSNAGDVNGDGIQDLIIGAPGVNNNAGETYVVFGSNSSIRNQETLSLSSLNGLNGFKIKGIKGMLPGGLIGGDLSGYSVSNAGDVNGDGIDDLIIGAPEADRLNGETYVIFGSRNLANQQTLSLANLNGTNGFKIAGNNQFENIGSSVSDAGDVNGDGINDMIIGAPRSGSNAGASYVVFGSKNLGSQGTLYLANLIGTNGFKITGANRGDEIGTSVSKAGDVNGDGIDDLIIGAPRSGSNAGASYVVFGSNRSLGSQGTLSLASLNGINGFKITGVNGGDKSGTSVSNAGDVNGDGIDDLIIGAPKANDNAGVTYVVFGSKNIGNQGTFFLTSLNGTNGFKITGITDYTGSGAGDHSGTSVSNAGDVNGDGIDDLIIGAPSADLLNGETYVIFGSKNIGDQGTLSLASLNGTNGFTLRGRSGSGASVSNAGDVNGDGIDDLIIGAPWAGSGPGVAYVVLRSTLPSTSTSPSLIVIGSGAVGGILLVTALCVCFIENRRNN